MSSIAFGEGNAGQWMSYGFDIDNQPAWTVGDTNHCQPNSGASPTTAFPTGPNGIDNSFGHIVLPTLLAVDASFTTDTNNGLTNGIFSVLLKMYCLPPTGDVSGMTTKQFDGTTLGITGDGGTQTTPKWDGTDQWPVDPSLLTNPNDPSSSAIVYPASSVSGTTFDTGPGQTFVLRIPLNLNGNRTSLKLTLNAARVTMTLGATRESATGGMVGGVIDTEDLVAQVATIADVVGICSSSIYTSLITLVRQSSDIMADGTQDPTKVCNGISIGLGFQMQGVELGPVGVAPPAQQACTIPDAGM